MKGDYISIFDDLLEGVTWEWANEVIEGVEYEVDSDDVNKDKPIDSKCNSGSIKKLRIINRAMKSVSAGIKNRYGNGSKHYVGSHLSPSGRANHVVKKAEQIAKKFQCNNCGNRF